MQCRHIEHIEKRAIRDARWPAAPRIFIFIELAVFAGSRAVRAKVAHTRNLLRRPHARSQKVLASTPPHGRLRRAFVHKLISGTACVKKTSARQIALMYRRKE